MGQCWPGDDCEWRGHCEGAGRTTSGEPSGPSSDSRARSGAEPRLEPGEEVAELDEARAHPVLEHELAEGADHEVGLPSTDRTPEHEASIGLVALISVGIAAGRRPRFELLVGMRQPVAAEGAVGESAGHAGRIPPGDSIGEDGARGLALLESGASAPAGTTIG